MLELGASLAAQSRPPPEAIFVASSVGNGAAALIATDRRPCWQDGARVVNRLRDAMWPNAMQREY